MSQLHRPGGHPKHSFTSLKYLTSDFESYSAPYVSDKKWKFKPRNLPLFSASETLKC